MPGRKPALSVTASASAYILAYLIHKSQDGFPYLSGLLLYKFIEYLSTCKVRGPRLPSAQGAGGVLDIYLYAGEEMAYPDMQSTNPPQDALYHEGGDLSSDLICKCLCQKRQECVDVLQNGIVSYRFSLEALLNHPRLRSLPPPRLSSCSPSSCARSSCP